MGLFSRRAKSPIEVGRAICLVPPDGRAFVREHNHPNIPAQAVAALAPITWALHLVRANEAAGTVAVSRLLHDLTAHETASEHNRHVNPRGVIAGDAPSGQSGYGAVSAFCILPTSDLTGSWQGSDGADRPGIADRVYGALWHVAALHDSEGVVRHAVAMMRDSFDETGGFAQGADLHMPQMLLDHGAQMAAFDEQRGALLDAMDSDDAPAESAPGPRDWQVIRTSAGGFVAGTWQQFIQTSARLTDGTWQSMYSPSTDRIALAFVADAGPRFFCPADEITSASVAAKGLNISVGVGSGDGDFLCVGPGGRVQEIFSGLGFPL
jgi:hypothetical protein